MIMAETINIQQNNLVVAGDFHYHAANNDAPQEDLGEDVLENLIFGKSFDSNQKLLLLRKEIANSIELGSATPLYTDTIGLDRAKIDPQMKNEWFYI